MLPTRMRLAAWLVVFSMQIAACQPLPGAVVVSAPGLVEWLDQPPDGAVLPFEPFTLRAHARSAGASGVEAISFLVSAGGPPVSLGSVTTDPAQPLVMAELVWNPSAPGEYAIQAQASNAQGDVFSAFARVCVSDLAAAGGVCAEPNAATTPGTTAAPGITPTETPSGPTGTATRTPRLSATPKPTSSSAPASATVAQAVASATGTPLPPTATFTLPPPSDTPKPTDTPVPADTAPPAIDKLSAVPNPTAYGNACTKEESQFTASATVIDPSGVAGVTPFYRYGSGGKVGSWLTAGMGALGGDQYAATVTNDANAIYTLLGGADGYVEYYLQAQDALGNSGQSSVPVITLQYCLG